MCAIVRAYCETKRACSCAVRTQSAQTSKIAFIFVHMAAATGSLVVPLTHALLTLHTLHDWHLQSELRKRRTEVLPTSQRSVV